MDATGRRAALRDAVERRIPVPDAVMGTEIQARGLDEAKFRGERFRDHPLPLCGDCDTLSRTRPDVVEATHRADVDAGADIVETNPFTATRIAQAEHDVAARAEGADLVGRSGLIPPSLDEMAHAAREMERRGYTAPLLIGGATTSRALTAVRIASAYHAPAVHVPDASRPVGVAGALFSPAKRDALAAEVRRQHDALPEAHGQRSEGRLLPLDEARRRAFEAAHDDYSTILGKAPAGRPKRSRSGCTGRSAASRGAARPARPSPATSCWQTTAAASGRRPATPPAPTTPRSGPFTGSWGPSAWRTCGSPRAARCCRGRR